MSMNESIAQAKKRPILIGLLAVVGVLSAGMTIAFATGMTAPELAHAIIVTPPCCVTVPPPPVIPPPPPVVVPPPPPPVIDTTPPCCTTEPPAPVTPPPPPPVTPPAPPPVIDTTPPCCTTEPPPPVTPPPPPVTPTPTIPPVVKPPVTPTPPVIPPVIPPVEPPYVPPPVDVCPNIPGLQSSIPSGMVKTNGNCVTPPPPVDVCPNIPGNQATIPSGMIKNASGNCVTPPPPVDVCPNIAGNQATIPSGMIKDSSGNCVTPPPPVDVCPNIPGNQGSVPPGMVKDASGNCITPQPETPQPVCTLSISPTSINRGETALLRWTTQNATSVTLNHGLGAYPGTGETVVQPTSNTTYVLTATGHGKTVTCTASIVVKSEPPQPEAPVCTLTASPTSIVRGGSATLTWTTDRATSVSIDQGIGNVALDGSRSVSPNQTTTYTLTATGNGRTVTCDKTIVVTETPEAPACFLTVTPSEIDEGDSATIRWGGTRISAVAISEGIGSVPTSGEKTVSPREGFYTYVGSFTTTNGQVITCSDTLRVEDDNGGGGGKTRRSPRVSLDDLPRPDELPFSFVYLDEIPYTGIELGPMGMVLYWLTLIGASAGLAYFVVYQGIPFAVARLRGESAAHSVAHQPAHHPEPAHAAMTLPTGPAEVAKAYSAYEGFKSFAQGGTLSIDDIVSGLARETHAPVEPAPVAPAAALPSHAEAMMATHDAAPASFETAYDVPGFVSALLSGNRDATFDIIRQVTRAGDSAEEFLTHAVVALDDAYRAKIDGTPVHPAVASLTRDAAPAFLEKVIGALTAAVDGTYSTGVTGVKLAVTRALNVVNG